MSIENRICFSNEAFDLDVREDGGLDVVALVAAGLPSGDQRGAFPLSDVNVLENLLVLVLVNLHCKCNFTAVDQQLVTVTAP